mmetsp:Transcript_2329/g.8332  ORF Transcript_2329/g.8332 Transcript_2329/m.8332 type:complete len:218 (-) Transcript_2329:1883-2536(-)
MSWAAVRASQATISLASVTPARQGISGMELARQSKWPTTSAKLLVKTPLKVDLRRECMAPLRNARRSASQAASTAMWYSSGRGTAGAWPRAASMANACRPLAPANQAPTVCCSCVWRSARSATAMVVQRFQRALLQVARSTAMPLPTSREQQRHSTHALPGSGTSRECTYSRESSCCPIWVRSCVEAGDSAVVSASGAIAPSTPHSIRVTVSTSQRP